MTLGVHLRYYCINLAGACRHAERDRVFTAAEFASCAGMCRPVEGEGCGQPLAAGEPLDRRRRWMGIGLTGLLLAGGVGWEVRQLLFPPPLEHLDFASHQTEVSDQAGVLAIEIVRGAGLDRPASVDYAAADGSAKAGQDYTAVRGTLAFAPGEQRKTLSVSLLPDITFQKGRRYFSLVLLNVRDTPQHLIYIDQPKVAGNDKLLAEQTVLAASRTAKDIADYVVRKETLDKLLLHRRSEVEEFRQYQQSLAVVSGNLSRARESYLQMLRDFKSQQPAVVLGAMDHVAYDLQQKGFIQQAQAVTIMKRQFGELLRNSSADMDRWAQELSQVVPRIDDKLKRQT